MAVAAEKPTHEGQELLEQLVVVDDLDTAALAAGQLAARYHTVHPRAAQHGWVVEDRVGEFILFWRRYRDRVPDRVWAWREDFGSFTQQEALCGIEEIIRPAKLGQPREVLFASNLQFEHCYVELSDPKFPLYERSVFANDWVTVFYRFLLRPWRRDVWANLPRVERIASQTPFHPQQSVHLDDPSPAAEGKRP
ncbi:MAG: hypothetical protein U0795_01405 [Pirellulales bacterium]